MTPTEAPRMGEPLLTRKAQKLPIDVDEILADIVVLTMNNLPCAHRAADAGGLVPSP